MGGPKKKLIYPLQRHSSAAELQSIEALLNLSIFQITAKSTEEKSRHYIYIIFKIVVCVVLISILYMSQVSESPS